MMSVPYRRVIRRLAALSAGGSVVVALGAAATAHATADARLFASGGTWGKAREVATALNQGREATINSVSCASAGNCSAGGTYTDSSGRAQAFVASETNGIWGTAAEVAAALNTGGRAAITSVSCASAGNCSAGGSYSAGPGSQQAFVVTETNGTWGTAAEVAGALNTGGSAVINSVSCASAGNCSAGGSYYSGSPGTTYSQAFVVDETNGTWGTAAEVAAALNQGSEAAINSVSCASAGNCSAGGSYDDASGHLQAFVIGETNGTWGTAAEVAAALNTGGSAQINSVSCASAGNCSAGGSYRDRSGNFQAFVINARSGGWRAAEEVPGSAALNQGGDAVISSVSCASAGNCGAGGSYDANGPLSYYQAFAVTETHGTWGTAQHVAAALSGVEVRINSVSCASPGNCSAGGAYRVGRSGSRAFVIDEMNGAWGQGQQVAGTLNTGGYAMVSSVSCATAASCGGGGLYSVTSTTFEAFVINRK